MCGGGGVGGSRVGLLYADKCCTVGYRPYLIDKIPQGSFFLDLVSTWLACNRKGGYGVLYRIGNLGL